MFVAHIVYPFVVRLHCILETQLFKSVLAVLMAQIYYPFGKINHILPVGVYDICYKQCTVQQHTLEPCN